MAFVEIGCLGNYTLKLLPHPHEVTAWGLSMTKLAPIVSSL
jgi:hypothetical protein